MTDQSRPKVAIVGAGASGILLANALVGPGAPLDVVLIDPKPCRGFAYGGLDEHHLLNLSAAEMSLDERSPGGFVDWLNKRRPRERGWTAEDFAPRTHFGDYLEERLRNLCDRTPGLGSTTVTKAVAVAAQRDDRSWTIRLSDGGLVQADVLLLATGPSRPRPLVFHGRAQVEAYVQDDPWNDADLRSIPPDGDVLLVGAGLTAADVAAALWRRDPERKVIAVSRHGLAPRAYAPETPDAPFLAEPLPTTARELYARLRGRADYQEGEGRVRPGVFRNLRADGSRIWDRFSPAEREMFQRHFRSYWNVERRRLPPVLAAVLEYSVNTGRLEFVHGRLAEAKAMKDGARALVALLTNQGPRAVKVSRIINCTGPETDVYRSRNPLILDLLAQGLASADSLGLGLSVDSRSAVHGASGDVTAGLFAIGALSQGQFFEATEIPALRAHAERLAAQVRYSSGRAAPERAPGLKLVRAS
jgi:uncharacterized NAD(P)/FAD-binding protein YdhS